MDIIELLIQDGYEVNVNFTAESCKIIVQRNYGMHSKVYATVTSSNFAEACRKVDKQISSMKEAYNEI